MILGPRSRLCWLAFAISSEESYCGSDVLIQGIELGVLKVPLHNVHIRSVLITGLVKLAVRHQLPVKGVSLIIGTI